MKRKTFAKLGLAVVVLVVLACIGGYFYASASEPFQAAEKAIETSSAVQDKLGQVEAVRLSPFPFGYSIKFTGPSGAAAFKCNVVGSKASGVVYVELQREAGLWKITEASLNGETIQFSAN